MSEITLTQVGNVVFIRPWMSGTSAFDDLAEELTCERRVRNPLGYWMTVDQPLYSVSTNDDGEEACITHGGLFNRIKKVLRAHRLKFRVVDKRKLLPDPDWTKLPPLRKKQPEAIAAIISAHRGFIVCCTGFGKSFVIKTLCVMYPHLKILVVSRLGRVTKSLYNKISEAVDGPVGRLFGTGPDWPEEAKVVVTTIASMHKVPTSWPDVIFFDEAHNAGAMDASEVLCEFAKSKLFGFTATPKGRGDNSDLVTEAFFGEYICEVPYQEAEKDGTVPSITAVFVHIDIPDIDTDGMSAMDKNKEGYWWNEIRNRRLLAEADKIYREDESVLYYVENMEHALYLRLLIPGTPIAHGPVSKKRRNFFLKKELITVEDEESLKKPDIDQLEADFMAGEIKRVICTPTWKEGVDFPDLAGLVRFDGGAGDIGSEQIPGRLSRKGTDGKKTHAIVIDALDNFGKRYRDRSLTRRRVYLKNGWKIVGWEK